MIVLTGNPGIGVDNEAIMQALSKLKDAVGDRVILTAGKMHASGNHFRSRRKDSY